MKLDEKIFPICVKLPKYPDSFSGDVEFNTLHLFTIIEQCGFKILPEKTCTSVNLSNLLIIKSEFDPHLVIGYKASTNGIQTVKLAGDLVNIWDSKAGFNVGNTNFKDLEDIKKVSNLLLEYFPIVQLQAAIQIMRQEINAFKQ